jgi:hypothetical protein
MISGSLYSKPVLQEYIDPSLAKSSVFMEDAEDAFGKKEKTLHMKGIFIQGDVRNHNQRIYPVFEIKRAVQAIRDQIKNNTPILGQLDHPDDLKISLDRVSHAIVDMEMDGPNGIGKLKILPTPLGNLAKSMLEAGVRLGVSSRGSGNVNESNGHVSDFEIITVDIVAQPSAPAAYPTAIYEGLGNRQHGYKLFDMSAEAVQDRKVQKYLKEELLKAIKDLKWR